MSEKQYRDFLYVKEDGYDKKIKVNDEDLAVYSKKKLNDLYPDKDYEILGETFEGRKRDKTKDIGRIELNEQRLNVGTVGKCNKVFKKQAAFVGVKGGYIAILKWRLLTFLLLGALLLGAIGGVICLTLGDSRANDGFASVSGTVTVDGTGISGVTVSLQRGETEIQTATTNKKGNYLFKKVENGSYNVVCTSGNSVQTKLAVVANQAVAVNFAFLSNSEVKAIVKTADDNTPPIAVGGLSEEAMRYAAENKNVEVTLFAEKAEESEIAETEKTSIQKISGNLDLTYYGFSVLLEVFKNNALESSEYLKNTDTVLEIAVPFDSVNVVGTYVFRYHDDAAMRFKRLSARPTQALKDGTYYVTDDTVFIYTNCFSTYAIASTDEEKSSIIKPDYSLEDEDENQTPVEADTSNVVRLIIPSGKLYFKFALEEKITDNATITLYHTSEGTEYQIFSDKVNITDGEIAESEIDFASLHHELIAGTYEGRIVLKLSDLSEREIKIKLYIVNSQGGKVGMGYSTAATVDLESGNIEMMYILNMDATHNAIIQLIVVKGDEKYCIAQSGIVTVGHKLEKMTLIETYKSMLQEGHYKGILRLNLYNEDNPIVGMQPEAEIDIVVK